jgi:hypothetical protein
VQGLSVGSVAVLEAMNRSIDATKFELAIDEVFPLRAHALGTRSEELCRRVFRRVRVRYDHCGGTNPRSPA